jgi:hypothetical protein
MDTCVSFLFRLQIELYICCCAVVVWSVLPFVWFLCLPTFALLRCVRNTLSVVFLCRLFGEFPFQSWFGRIIRLLVRHIRYSEGWNGLFFFVQHSLLSFEVSRPVGCRLTSFLFVFLIQCDICIVITPVNFGINPVGCLVNF